MKLFDPCLKCRLNAVFRRHFPATLAYDGIYAGQQHQVQPYSGLNLNQYGVASPCRTICTVCGFVALS
ncbi:TPA: hypothetical protein ACFU3M_000603 [Neisseria meningitidis]|uniref:Cytochrome, putative n=2 Tax=Neisseria meningitidis TaxID=487 RepID=A0A0H5QSU9_NEIMI|nr:hypothetical protein [Neisseria meningitidis]CCA45120.1 hypothetical protein NMALPHA522_1579 [Neisseria meningitidis alpha522]MCL4989615.1 hypothetical protein [Neisseria meningitidis]MCL5683858.1 hypothetical protein [Neisseria meningitidis]MCL5688492.1 hypothetical protein [Neisseria meningitidis]MCL5700008.1 hypothetical protein [Neisseria meningitidis]